MMLSALCPSLKISICSLIRNDSSILSKQVCFSFIGLTFEIDCGDTVTESLVSKNFDATEIGRARNAKYIVCKTDEYFLVESPYGNVQTAATDAEFLYALEKAITLEAQRQRPTLYFIHGAVLEFEGKAILLIGAPGAGKSTLAWALLHHGFQYLSDELAPIDLSTLTVYPYPHAICLKKKPPAPYALPEGVLYTSGTIHIPVKQMPSATCTAPQPVRSLFFVTYDPSAMEPSILPIGRPEGAARLYSNTLNALAHAGAGLGQAISIAKACRCFTLRSASAPATCLALKDVLTKAHN